MSRLLKALRMALAAFCATLDAWEDPKTIVLTEWDTTTGKPHTQRYASRYSAHWVDCQAFTRQCQIKAAARAKAEDEAEYERIMITLGREARTEYLNAGMEGGTA